MSQPVQAAGSLAGSTIVVDPGHGGFDSGALGNGLMEKAITLAIGRAVGADLRWAGARVVLTRNADETIGPPGHVAAGLAARAELANRLGADAFISVHANALNDPSLHGVMTFYGLASGYVGGVVRPPELVAASRRLAAAVQAAVLDRTGAVDDGVSGADFYVLGHAAMPAILVETGFLTNPAEAQQLATPSYQQAVAAGISTGVGRFLAGQDVGAPPPERAPTSDRIAAGVSTYVVRPGDTLSQLALRFGVSQAVLARRNGLSSPDALVAGQSLRVPVPAQGQDSPATSLPTAPPSVGSDSYVVQPGDTLSGLARHFQVSEAALRQVNGLREPDRLLAGQRLRLPGGATSATESASPVATGTSIQYRVRPGDTLSGIALHFDVSVAALAAANDIRDTDRLVAGHTLQIRAAHHAPRGGG